MNSIIESKKTPILACCITAMLYALLVGEQSLIYRLADGVIYGVILFPVGFIVWNIFRYAIPAKKESGFLFIIIVTFAILTSILIVGIESFAVYLFFTDSFPDFARTIPVRLFITLLLFVIYRLFYLAYLTELNDSVSANEPPSAQTEIIDRITVRNGQKIKIIAVNDIIFLRADGDYVDIHTAEGHWLKEQTMKYTEDTLPPDRFVRTHRSYIVNIHHISRIERYGEQHLIVLTKGEKIKISNARYQVLKQRLGL
jgi:hypothetical protein